MNAMTRFFSKALRAIRHPTGRFTGGSLARTRFDYRKEIEQGLDSSVVTAPVGWLQRSLPEARLAVRVRRRNGTTAERPDHPMLALIQRPNEFYSDIALWQATVLSLCVDGNAYWLIVRNGAGKPVELWYVPHWLIEPRREIGSEAFLDHYLYAPGAGVGTFRIDPEDVVHFRHGLNPRNLLKGLSPLDGVVREIFADLESSNFVASLLRNMGVPGVVISPKNGVMPTGDDVAATKAWFTENFGGDKRGGTLVLGAPTDVQPYGFNPQQMNLSEARDVAEERVCACLGVPAAVVGFGAGLQQTQVGATMTELRKLAWHNGVLPLARGMADELNRSLLPLFPQGGRPEQLEVYWDTDDVLALQEDEDKQVDRLGKQLASGGITVFEYRQALGHDADDSHRIYLRSFSIVEVPEGTRGRTVPETTEPPEPDGSEPPPAKARRGRKGRKGEGHDHPALPDGSRSGSEAEIARGERFVNLLRKQENGLRRAMEQSLVVVFAGWREATLEAAQTALGSGSKAENDDLVQRILDLLKIDAWRLELTQAYSAHYLEVASAVQDAMEQAGLGTRLPDPVMRAIVASGGRRVGLIDLDRQTRQAVFDALAEGAAEGEGAEALAGRIADHVEGGPWSDGITRARIIARTETKFAQNLSTIETAREAGIEEMMVFDGRLGPGRSLDSHIARNGSIVSIDEARTMAEAEHPNGTLSFAPHIEL